MPLHGPLAEQMDITDNKPLALVDNPPISEAKLAFLGAPPWQKQRQTMNTKTHSYSETTRDIHVSVIPQYLPDQSAPEDGRYVWAYTVRIENQGTETVQLRTRYWRITDALGTSHEVRGEGVVGEQPVLNPGEAFEYTSGTPLATPSGMMMGSYEMETQAGDFFDATVPAFSLDSPHERIHLN